MKRVFGIAVLSVLAFACSKQNEPIPEQKQQVEIEIVSPLPGQEIHNGDNVPIAVNIRAPRGLHEYRVRVLNGSEELFRREAHSHAEYKSLKWLWINKSGATELKLMVEASDHNLEVFTGSCEFFSLD